MRRITPNERKRPLHAWLQTITYLTLPDSDDLALEALTEDGRRVYVRLDALQVRHVAASGAELERHQWYAERVEREKARRRGELDPEHPKS